jgi:hypothetical protein
MSKKILTILELFAIASGELSAMSLTPFCHVASLTVYKQSQYLAKILTESHF